VVPLGIVLLLELVAVTSGPQIMFAQEVLPLVWGVMGPSVIQGVMKNRRCLHSVMILYNAYHVSYFSVYLLLTPFTPSSLHPHEG